MIIDLAKSRFREKYFGTDIRYFRVPDCDMPVLDFNTRRP